MKKRVVVKKGKIIVTRRGNVVTHLSEKIISTLKPYCYKIQIAGSIRREEKNPVDIDVVLIPKNKEKLEEKMSKLGRFIQGGEKKSSWHVKGVKVELYYTFPEEWGATLLAYSSTIGSSIGLRVVAKKKGFKLTQHGLFKGKKLVAGKTEEEIYKALGRPYKEPKYR